MSSPTATIFVIDDDPSVRKAFRRVIALAGHAVEAFSAEAYLKRTAPAPPGCLVLDIRMPGMSGLDLQKAVKATPHELPIVFVTGHGDQQAREQALSYGAVAVIDKPVDMVELLNAITQALTISAGTL